MYINKSFLKDLTLHEITERIERKKLSGLPSGCSSTKLYKKIIDENFPPGYQVQCMNCNHGRGRNNNPDHICPHKRK